MPGDQPVGADCGTDTPPVDVCPDMPGDQPVGTDCDTDTPPVDVCPTMPGNQPVGTVCETGTPDVHKVTICHATGNGGFVVIEVDENGLNGHGDHADDVIPMPAAGCPTPTTPVDVCPTMPGDQPEGTDCGGDTDTPVDVCPDMPGDQPEGTDCGGDTDTPVDVCPDMPGDQPVGTTCEGGGSTGGEDNGGGTITPPNNTDEQPVTGGTTTPVINGRTTTPAAVEAPASAGALPFTGSDTQLQVELAGLLLLLGSGLAVAGRKKGAHAL
jgi:hypothetical protein